MLEYSDEGIRRVLKRLRTQGIVDALTIGRTTSYRLNHEHVAASAVVRLANLQSEFIKRVETALETWTEQPMYAAVFGSAARSEMTDNSDIDILVVRRSDSPSSQWDAQLANLAGAVLRWTGNYCEVLDLSERQVVSGDPVLRDVLKHGWTVFGTSAWLRRRVRIGGATREDT